MFIDISDKVDRIKSKAAFKAFKATLIGVKSVNLSALANMAMFFGDICVKLTPLAPSMPRW